MCALMALTAAPLSGLVGLELTDLFSLKAEAINGIQECPYGDEYSCYASQTPHCHCEVVNDEAVVTLFLWPGDEGAPSPAQVSIPSSHCGYPVTTIGEYSMSFMDDTTSITIPNSVKKIEKSAFIETGITNLIIPDSVTYIGDSAFAYCDNLMNVDISGNGATTIGNYVFRKCPKLTDVTIGDGVTAIGDYAFGECDNLRNVTIGNGVKSLGEQAFYSCSSLESVTIGTGLTAISYETFYKCVKLNNVVIGENVTTIGEGAFRECIGLKNVSVPDSVTTIGLAAFFGCAKLESILLSQNLTTIGQSAFVECYSLKNIIIPEGVTTIGGYAFADCDSLKKVTIPESVTSIGKGPFQSCDSLETILVDENNENYTDDGGVLFDKDKTLLIQYPKGNQRSKYIIPDGVTTIGDVAFYGCNRMEYIHIPESVSSVGYGAFISIGNAYICSTSEDSYAKKYADANNKIFVVCHHSEYAHTPKTITIPATCTLEGTEYVVCEECGATISERVIPSKGHTAGDWTVTVRATCTENGTKVKTCVDCDEFMHSEPILATGHTPGEWVVVKPATTTTTGIKAQKCANCSEILTSEETPVLVAKVHDVSMSGASVDYKSSITIAPVITVDEGVKYTVTYSSSNPEVVVVDENGNLTATGKGTAEITVTVTDENGNVVTDTCEVEVKYNWWQWIIVIVLFGWIWY